MTSARDAIQALMDNDSQPKLPLPEHVYWRVVHYARQQGLNYETAVEELLSKVTPMPRRQAVVQAGEGLSQVSFRLYGTMEYWTYISEMNPDIKEPEFVVEPGQIIDVPGCYPMRYTHPWEGYDDVKFYWDFGHRHPNSSKYAGTPHPGIDFDVGHGRPIYAPGDGVVMLVQDDRKGYGHYIMIEHDHASPVSDFFYTLFAHLMDVNVLTPDPYFVEPEPGDVVRQGDIIGFQGRTGNVGSRSHVHYECKKTRDLSLYVYLRRHPEVLPRLFVDPIDLVVEGCKFTPIVPEGLY